MALESLDPGGPKSSSSPVVSVRPSLAVELCWAMHGVGGSYKLEERPTLAALYKRRPDLASRIASFWGDEVSECGGAMELLVLVHFGGALFSTDLQALLDSIAPGAASAPRDLPLSSEHPGDREGILQRLERLRESPSLRSEYGQLLSEVWNELDTTWRTEGRPAVDSACAYRRRIADSGGWEEAARRECLNPDKVPDLVSQLGPEGQIAVVPAFFSCKGLVLDLPELVLVGVNTASGVSARARTEQLARRLRAVADPTRFAMLCSLKSAARTVGELAGDFGVSQPTVSNHLKVLTEAGLVANERKGSRRLVLIESEALESLLGQISAELVPSADAPTDS